MKVNKQSKIKVNKSGYKRARFNWSHDVNTTFTWGEIQPTQCKMLIPGSKTTMQAQNLIRLAPMVAPTFGRVKYKTFNQFVPCADVYPNFDPMMAQEPITRNGVTKVPKVVPSITLGQLSSYVLFGARANIYWADNAADALNGKYKTRYRRVVNNNSTDWLMDSKMQEIRGYFTSANIFKVVNNGINHNSSDGVLPHVAGFDNSNTLSRVVWFPKAGRTYLDMSFDGDTVHSTTDTSYGITLGMSSLNSLFPIDRSLSKNIEPHAPVLDETTDADVEVTMEGADYVVEFNLPLPTSDNRTYLAIAFELSDYGKRLRKILQGCGYQIDLASTEKVSILPLLAQYKAYFDVFGLQLYQGWETTACAGLIDYISNNFVTHINGFDYTTGAENERMFSLPCYDTNDGMTLNNSRFIDFMLGEVANEWYTEDPDFIGAHIAKLAVSPKVDTTGFISVEQVDGSWKEGANITQPPNPNAIGGSDGQVEQNSYGYGLDSIHQGINEEVHGFINQIKHGEVDAELLKRMYRWTNRNTILGREIAKILRAQGLGKYVDECKSNYIGSTDTMITISDVVSMADTKVGDEGSSLGEFGGKGLQYIEDKTLVFENDEYGYWITLATIVPEAGYTQGIDPTLKCLDKFNLYNPDFDAIGMELTEKDTIVGCRYNVPSRFGGDDVIINKSTIGFGFIPRYSKFKVAQNLVNGDFNRHNRRNIYLPYTLDKQLNVNDYDSSYRYKQETGTDNSTGYATLKRSATTQNLPIASNIWRTPTKYAWLGNFNRIFLNTGLHDDLELTRSTTAGLNTCPGFSDYNDDNFLSHGIMDVQCYAPMKTIEDSYGLEDEDADKAGAEFVSKA